MMAASDPSCLIISDSPALPAGGSDDAVTRLASVEISGEGWLEWDRSLEE